MMRRLALASLVAACNLACAQTPAAATPPVERAVNGQTIVSNQLPAADLTVSSDFRYVGSQVVNLYGVADAEQHLFTTGEKTGPVSRFYWIQFEHYLPTNSHTYNYSPDRTTDIGGLPFVYDVKAYTDYGGANRDPRSDGAAVVALLAKHNLAFPARMARVRMFHLPSPDRRAELMIIYGEALPPQSSTPVSAGGAAVDTESPAEARAILQRALQGLTLRQHAR